MQRNLDFREGWCGLRSCSYPYVMFLEPGAGYVESKEDPAPSPYITHSMDPKHCSTITLATIKFASCFRKDKENAGT